MDKTYVTNGCSNHSGRTRHENDYYATHPSALELLLDIPEVYNSLDRNIWECACGGKHLSNVLTAKGFNVRNSDIIDRVHDGTVEELDFLWQGEKWGGDILTNPPYKYAQEFVEHAMNLVDDGHKVVMFLKLTFLETKSRKQMFVEYPLKWLYVSSSRLQCTINGDWAALSNGTAVAYGWFIFEKGCKDEPIIRWFN